VAFGGSGLIREGLPYHIIKNREFRGDRGDFHTSEIRSNF